MRITVPDEIMRLTVPTCTPSRDNPLVIVSSLEVGGPDLLIFVSVLSVLQVGCLRDSPWKHLVDDVFFSYGEPEKESCILGFRMQIECRLRGGKGSE